MFLAKFINPLLDQLFPSICLFCGLFAKRSISLCIACEQDLPILTHHCLQCAQVLTSVAICRCGDCLRYPKPYERTYALYNYEPPIVRLITALKFEHELSHAALLAHQFIQRIEHDWYHSQDLPQIILPVPLHIERLRERGFNQAIEIARPIAKRFKLKLDLHGVIRTKQTQAQSGLSTKERKLNMADAFTIHGNYQGKTIAILDDVVTTGQTVATLASALKQAGASTIHIWCAARTQASIALNSKTGYHRSQLTPLIR